MVANEVSSFPREADRLICEADRPICEADRPICEADRPICEAELQLHTDRVWCCSWSHSGETLASCSSDRKVCCWKKRRKTSASTAALTTEQEQTSQWECAAVLAADDVHKRSLRCVDWNCLDELLAVSSFDASVSIWAASAETSFSLRLTIEGHENEVKCVSWHPSRPLRLATCSRDKTVWVHDIADDFSDTYCVALLQGHSQDVKCVRWSRDGYLLASSSYDDTIKLWAPPADKSSSDDGEEEGEWECIQTLGGHTSTVWAISFLTDADGGDLLASCSADTTVKLWTRTPSQKIQRRPAEFCRNPITTQSATKKEENAEEVGEGRPVTPRDGDYDDSDAKASSGAVVVVHDTKRESPVNDKAGSFRTRPSADSPPACNRADVTKAWFISPLYRTQLWDQGRRDLKNARARWLCQTTLVDYHTRPIYSLHGHPILPLVLATACGDNGLKVFQRSIGGWFNCSAKEHAHDCDVNCVAWRPRVEANGRLLLATAGDDSLVKIWSVKLFDSD